MASLRAIWLRTLHWRRTAMDSCDRAAVLEHVASESALAPRYAFMTVLSSGIATLGLLQNSVAVIIGAMLISPLMGPIVELGMGLATFASGTVRRALGSLFAGIVLALLTSTAIVYLSPLKDATSEIVARTDPTLFDLLIAILSGLAGAYATITRKGETIVGVAIATALMPPLAVAGYGLALQNPHVAGGAFFLFMTNLLAIALSVSTMARVYGFEGADSPRQSALQAAIVISVFVVLSLPLGLALRKIVVRAQTERTVRTALDASASSVGGRVTTLHVDSSAQPLMVDAVFMAPRFVPGLDARIEAELHKALQRDVHVELREVVTTTDDTDALRRSTLEELRKSVAELQGAASSKRDTEDATAARDQLLRDSLLARMGTLQSIDGGAVRQLRLRADSGITLGGARAMEKSVGGDGAGTKFVVRPPVQPLLAVPFAAGSAELTDDAHDALATDAWALKRWNAPGVHATAHASGSRGRAQAAARIRVVVKELLQLGVAAEPGKVDVVGRKEAAGTYATDRVEIGLDAHD